MTSLPSPALALATVLSTTYAALFHLWQRGDMAALRLYLLTAWLGFAGGHLLGEVIGIHGLQVGRLSIFPGTAGAIVALFIARTMEA